MATKKAVKSTAKKPAAKKTTTAKKPVAKKTVSRPAHKTVSKKSNDIYMASIPVLLAMAVEALILLLGYLIIINA